MVNQLRRVGINRKYLTSPGNPFGDKCIIKTKNVTYHGFAAPGSEDSDKCIGITIPGNYFRVEEASSTPHLTELTDEYENARVISTFVKMQVYLEGSNSTSTVGISMVNKNTDPEAWYDIFNAISAAASPAEQPLTKWINLASAQSGRGYGTVTARGCLSMAAGSNLGTSSGSDILSATHLSTAPLDYYNFVCWAYNPFAAFADSKTGYKLTITTYRTVELFTRLGVTTT